MAEPELARGVDGDSADADQPPVVHQRAGDSVASYDRHGAVPQGTHQERGARGIPRRSDRVQGGALAVDDGGKGAARGHGGPRRPGSGRPVGAAAGEQGGGGRDGRAGKSGCDAARQMKGRHV
ncbi:hypothetical protein ABT187_42810 [Streptomyces sp. NPDC001817]|uniref:hypothetical protein n=1 Tax=Streptomyces sp. NPDC001817 TaxID=3154398 RepID=UPI003328BBBF